MDSPQRPVSLLLTVLATAAATGGLVGRAEVVTTGETVPLRSYADLAALLQRLVEPDAGVRPEPATPWPRA